MITMNITTAVAAEKLETDPRTLRKFLRSDQGMNSKVGKGKRWALEGDAKSIKELKGKFDQWVASRAPAIDDAPDA